MVRKIYEFPLFDIKEVYKELKKKRIRVPKWIEAEIKKLPPLEEKEMIIDIIPYELPFTINNEEDKKNLIELIKKIDNEELNKDTDDLMREIKTEHEIEIYYKETGEISGMSIKPVTTKVYTTTTTVKNRKKWTWMTIDAMYEKMILPKVIKRYSKTFGIQSPPGENEGSHDWRIFFNSITLKAKYME